MSAGKLSLKLIPDKFLDFVDKLQDLANISDVVKLKIDDEHILAYSTLSNDVSVLALKSYLLNTTDYITNFSSDKPLDYVIVGAGKFVKNLKFFNASSPITLEINYKMMDDELLHVRSARYVNGKLKITCVGGELSKIRPVNKETLNSRLDTKNSLWNFNVSKSDFSDVKKLSNINSEDRILTISVDDGKVSIMEDYKWELDVDNISYKNTKLVFNKKYLSNINAENETIKFNIFETFILVKDDNSSLMLSFETDFSTED